MRLMLHACTRFVGFCGMSLCKQVLKALGMRAAQVTGRLEHVSGKFTNLYSDLESEKQV